MNTYLDLSQLIRLSYSSHRRPEPEPSLFAHMKYGSRWRVRRKIRHLAPLDGCACAFDEWVYGKSTIISWHGSFNNSSHEVRADSSTFVSSPSWPEEWGLPDQRRGTPKYLRRRAVPLPLGRCRRAGVRTFSQRSTLSYGGKKVVYGHLNLPLLLKQVAQRATIAHLSNVPRSNLI